MKKTMPIVSRLGEGGCGRQIHLPFVNMLSNFLFVIAVASSKRL